MSSRELNARILLALALLFTGAVLGRANEEPITIEGPLSEAGDMGYYAIGGNTMLAVRPDSPEDLRLRAMTGQTVRVVVEGQR